MSTVTDLAPTGTLPFHEALAQAELLARQALSPDLHERISCAVSLVREGKAFQGDDHVWTVASTSKPDYTYRINGHGCSCEDAFYRAPEGRCKHVLAVLLSRKVVQLMQAPAQELAPVPTETLPPTPEPSVPQGVSTGPGEAFSVPCPSQPRRTIPAKYIQKLQGKDFVRYAGLLQLAQADGLVELSAVWTQNEAELSLAHAVAIFEDGRRYEESGDSTPQNAKNIGLHWRRMSLTRAKARCLRDALGIEECSVEEMES